MDKNYATLAAEMVILSHHAKGVLPKHSVFHSPAHDFTGLGRSTMQFIKYRHVHGRDQVDKQTGYLFSQKKQLGILLHHTDKGLIDPITGS